MMIYRVIAESLQKKGFVQSSGNPDTAEFLIKVTEDRVMHICSIIKNIKGNHITAEVISESSRQLERKFLLSGYSDVKVMNIIVTDKDEDCGMLQEQGTRFWIVDMRTLRLMIFENQPEDYFSLRNRIEQTLIERAQEENNSPLSYFDRMKIPYVTAAIIFINIAVFLLCELIGSTEDIDLMIKMGALSHEFIYESHAYYRFITSMFLHFGFLHLANNMFMLAIVGTQLENVIGHLRFALIYLVSGLGAGVASVIFHMLLGENVVAAGASGAIYGIFGAMLVMIIRNRHDNFMLRRILVVIFLLIFGSIQEEIDFAAHAGGLIIGIIAGFSFSSGLGEVFKQ